MRPRFGTSESSRHVRVTVVGDDDSKQERSLRPDHSKPGSTSEKWDAAYGRSPPGLGWLCFGILVLWRPLELISPYIPTIIFKAFAALVLALLAYKLLTFRRWADETAHVRRFAVCFGVLVVELLVENFFVWVVSALDERKYNYTSLQDNLDRLLRPLEAQYGLLRAFLRYKAANAASLLLILLAVPFSVLWDQIPYSGFGLMSRAVLTMAVSRGVRVVCFMLTVLPSPRPGCYARRFPPVPESWWGFLRVGIGTLKGFGGCNDLIISGHGGVWIMPALVLQEYYPQSRLPWMLVAVYAHNSVRTVLERQHYSVDMLLAALVTAAVWRELRFLYHPSDSRLRLHRPPGTPADPVHPAVLAFIAIILLIVAIIVIVGGA